MGGLVAYETVDRSGPVHAEGVGALRSHCGRVMLQYDGLPWPPLRSEWPADVVLCPQCEQQVYDE